MDPASWISTGLPILGVILALAGLVMAWVSARRFDLRFGDASAARAAPAAQAPVQASASTFKAAARGGSWLATPFGVTDIFARGSDYASSATAAVPVEFIIRSEERPVSKYGLSVSKRAIDISVALAALIFLFPLLSIIAVTISLSDRGPVFFSHRRIGQNGRSFSCLKFRSMVRDGETALAAYLAADPRARLEWAKSQTLARDPRVTGLGRILRRTSLDALPQFVNVIRGEMSLVGPNAIAPAQPCGIDSDLEIYLSCRPGMTGPWRLAERDGKSRPDRIKLDIDYVRTCDLRQDVRILIRTVMTLPLGK